MSEHTNNFPIDPRATDRHAPSKGISVNSFVPPGMVSPGYPDGSPLWNQQRNGELPQTHGFPLDSAALLLSQLDLMDEEACREEEKWKDVGVDPEEEAFFEDKQEARNLDEEVPIETILEEEVGGGLGMTYDELVKPLSTEQIRKARNENQGKRFMPKLIPETYVFVLGGHGDRPRKQFNDEGEPLFETYDDTEDRQKYEGILTDIMEGRAMMGTEKIESVMNTTKFKIFMKIYRYGE